MKQFILSCLLISGVTLFSTNQSLAQDTTSINPKYKFGIGAGAGFTTGYGLSFRYIPNRFGAQVNFSPYKDSQTSRYSVGVTLIYMLIESRVTSFFLYQGNHYYYHSQMQIVYDPNFPQNQETEKVVDSYVNNGFGFGIELIFAKRIGLNLMAGYAFYNNFSQLNVTGETALYFKF